MFFIFLCCQFKELFFFSLSSLYVTDSLINLFMTETYKKDKNKSGPKYAATYTYLLMSQSSQILCKYD